MVFEIHGTKQVVTQTQKMIVGLDRVTGKLLWSLPFTTPFEQNIVTPIQSGSLLIFGGLQQPTFAVRVNRNGSSNNWTPSRVWETRDASFYMSTPVLAGGKLYGLSHKSRGQLVAIDAATGKLLWSGDGRLGDNASLIATGNVILLLPVDGVLRVYRPQGDGLLQIAGNTVADTPTWAMPALDRNHIVVKDQTSVILWDLPAATN
jgi:outer membrane protein assembly factor BamB